MADALTFEEFVASRSPAFLRLAYGLTRDHAHAEDLLQTALVRTWPAWKRIAGDPEPYVRRVLVNTHNSWWRRRWNGERATGELPETAMDHPQSTVDERDEVWRALGRLPQTPAGGAGAAILRGSQRGTDRRDPRHGAGHGEKLRRQGFGSAAPRPEPADHPAGAAGNGAPGSGQGPDQAPRQGPRPHRHGGDRGDHRDPDRLVPGHPEPVAGAGAGRPRGFPPHLQGDRVVAGQRATFDQADDAIFVWTPSTLAPHLYFKCDHEAPGTWVNVGVEINRVRFHGIACDDKRPFATASRVSLDEGELARAGVELGHPVEVTITYLAAVGTLPEKGSVAVGIGEAVARDRYPFPKRPNRLPTLDRKAADAIGGTVLQAGDVQSVLLDGVGQILVPRTVANPGPVADPDGRA